MNPPFIDERPKSDFVREMEAAITRRLAAVSRAGKAAIDREIAGIVKQYLGRDAWQAMLDAERETEADVPRATSRDRIRHKRSVKVGRARRRYPEGFDYKALQAGDGKDDE